MNHSNQTIAPQKRNVRVIVLPWAITAVELAAQLEITPSKVIAQLLEFGRCVTRIDANIPFADAARVAELNGVKAKPASAERD